MLETFSPGMPTIDTGYGPRATSSAAPARPAPARTYGRRAARRAQETELVDGRPHEREVEELDVGNAESEAEQVDQPGRGDEPAERPHPYLSCSPSSGGVKATIAR